jgi:hypothetical protein
MNVTAQGFFANGGIARGMNARQFVGIVCLFWLYVTLSDVVYAYGVSTGFAHLTSTEMLFAPWDVRVCQHLLLFPALMASFWASLLVEWRPLWLALPIQLTLAGAFAAIGYPAMLLAHFLMHDTHPPEPAVAEQFASAWHEPALRSLWLASFVAFLPAYGFGLALVRSAVLYTRVRDSEVQVAELEREWSAARLAALRMQLSPHTLFNLLHTIRGNIEWDPRGAQAMVVQLADLLRRLLSAGERDFSRLGDELQFAAMYLELQQRRFTDRIRFVLPVGAEIPAVWVPSLILQPLIENAVVHGLAGHQAPIDIAISARVAGEVLHLRVTNTIGPARRAGSEGIGLQNVRERLGVQFGKRGTLRAAAEDSVWIVDLTLPAIRVAPDARGRLKMVGT